jgi:hypothetical protein
MSGKTAGGIILCFSSAVAGAPALLPIFLNLILDPLMHTGHQPHEKLEPIFFALPLITGLVSAGYIGVLLRLKTRSGLILSLIAFSISLFALAVN